MYRIGLLRFVCFLSVAMILPLNFSISAQGAAQAGKAKPEAKQEKRPAAPKEQKVATQHSVRIGGRKIDYTAATGQAGSVIPGLPAYGGSASACLR